MINKIDKVKKLQKEILDFSINHCHFHYQGSYEYFNIGFSMLKLGMFKEAIQNLNKSLHLYRENADSYYIRGLAKYLLENLNGAKEDFDLSIKHRNLHPENYINDTIKFIPYDKISNLKDIEDIHHDNRNIRYEKLKSGELQMLYGHAHFAFNARNFADLIDIYQRISKITAKIHFDYHVDLANMYFELAKECANHNHLYEAIFFLDKALEADEKNPNNKEYKILKDRFRISIKDFVK